MKVLIAGGTGFIGRHVVDALRAHRHEVVLLARGTRRPPGDAGVVAADLAHQPPPLDHFQGAEAVVNLIGIKRADGDQTFEAVHVDATRRLVDAARQSGVRRFVQVSVVCSRPDRRHAYHDTKWRAEQIVRESGLDFTILRPGVVYGPGDDMVTHLLKMIRFATVFPVVGAGRSILQPVDARDVAAAVAAALDRPEASGATYDVVGPERLTLRRVVEITAEGAGLATRILPTPVPLMRLAVRAMDATSRQPLSTPAQLQMLVEGLAGDPEPARRDLGLEPRKFTPAAVAELEPAVPPLFGWSLRLVDRRAHAEWLARRRRMLTGALWVAVLGGAWISALALWLPNVWHRLAVGYLALVPASLASVRIGWRELWKPSWRRVVHGLLAGIFLYLAGYGGFQALTSVPSLAAEVPQVLRWKEAVPPGLVLPFLLFIIAGEEIVWRCAVGLPLAARLGPWLGSAAAAVLFAAAHLALGVHLLLAAAFALGLVWSALVVKTRSAVPAFVCHVLWDLAVLFVVPYGA